MRVTEENINDINFIAGTSHSFERSRGVLKSLLFDLEVLNDYSDKGCLFIDYVDRHTTYSPERTDPCPDYYGYFMLRWEDEPSETLGTYMTLDDMDNALFVLLEYIEHKPKRTLMTKINLNDYVWVELTEYGWQSLTSYYKKLFSDCYPFATVEHYVERHKKQTAPHTIDGVERMLTCFQLYEFMDCLGSKMYMGNKNVVENNNLYFGLENERDFERNC